MYAEERQQRILREARERGRVEVASLSRLLDVTSETVRRDLTALERHGLLRRVHGGAIPLDRLGFEPGIAVRDTELTVVTNSLPIAMKLSTRPNLTMLFLGGRVRGRTLAAVDVWATRSLAETFVEVAFIGTNGFSVERGLTTPDSTEAAVKAAMIKSARRAVVLADHTKFGNDNLIRFGSLEDVDMLITDTGLDPLEIPSLNSTGVQVM